MAGHGSEDDTAFSGSVPWPSDKENSVSLDRPDERTPRGRARPSARGYKRSPLASMNHEPGQASADPDNCPVGEKRQDKPTVGTPTKSPRAVEYEPIFKNIYIEHMAVVKMSSKAADEFRANSCGINVQLLSGQVLQVPNPIIKMEHAFMNHPEVREVLKLSGYPKPWPIQAQVWPLIQRGHDVCVKAPEFSGKTLAFLLPAYAHVQTHALVLPNHYVRILVLAPTLELAVKLHAEAQRFNCIGMSSIVIHPGEEREPQIYAIHRGCKILIATPDRLNEFIYDGNLDVSHVSFVVLYAADGMLSTQYQASLIVTMAHIRRDRQTVLLSSTWPEGIGRFANSHMMNPVLVTMGRQDTIALKCCALSYNFLFEDEVKTKLAQLMLFVEAHRDQPNIKVAVFTSSHCRAIYIFSQLWINNVDSFHIREDLEFTPSERASRLIQMSSANYIVTTDYAARGIDIPNLTHIIHLDFPSLIEDYISRIGRARCNGKWGESLTFFTSEDSGYAVELNKLLCEAGKPVPPEISPFIKMHGKYLQCFSMPTNPNHYSYISHDRQFGIPYEL